MTLSRQFKESVEKSVLSLASALEIQAICILRLETRR